ncbi:hypothetical protein CfE428DRAFT_5613 [Chthoniobacter flavus Ellin428]|uniref:Uncharacterized protein n=1 Tax=Chthoniobacter flavus Ellin428 TaxID=497964 RepID=B4D9M3_9BACT|nr:hypothetical protein [Chthoniobacter flavus]EDY16804.1 hypothetical protein CfE428DRAFT_5613 [Chthoniobacter flavus Ellin428]TCO93371.1 hypothetical protein EV701_10475 [Chthoniobacter flavus]
MKTVLIVSCLSAFIGISAFSEPDTATATAAIPHPLNEATRLQQEFESRRAAALRPVLAWYRARLEALQQTEESPEAQEAIARALTSARETFWQEDQPELRQALLAQPWLWRSEDDAEGVATSFHPDGSVVHIGMRGTWRITGPCEVTILTEADERFVLRFNASLSAYEADRRNVSGRRLAAVP